MTGNPGSCPVPTQELPFSPGPARPAGTCPAWADQNGAKVRQLLGYSTGTASCPRTGINTPKNSGVPSVYPICSTKAGAATGPYVLCPGADIAEWVTTTNALPGNRQMKGGVCVDGTGAAPIASGCGTATQCAYFVDDSGKAVLAPDRFPQAQYLCSPPGTIGHCVEEDAFLCDPDGGVCRSARTFEDPTQTPLTLTQCTANCVAVPRFACNKEQHACVQVPRGRTGGLPLEQCHAENPLCNPASLYFCDIENGPTLVTNHDQYPNAKPYDECKAACLPWACITGSDGSRRCGYSDQAGIDRFPTASACFATCQQTSLSSAATTGIVVGSILLVALLCIVAWWWLRRRHDSLRKPARVV